MSRDSTATYIHTHSSQHADLFEEFCHPPSSSHHIVSSSNAANTANNNTSGGTNDPGMVHVPGHFLPFEEIHLPPHLMPLNPEDEDDVVPDMHAAFGIQSALNGQQRRGVSGAGGEGSGRGAHQEPIWRDLGLEQLMDNSGTGKPSNSSSGAKREGKKTTMLLMR